jgi:NAD(P)-dependent dehydrogenase (short-subunit alcohol dehydrogenase family)
LTRQMPFTRSSDRWTTADMPQLTGRQAIVTGANSGLGWETAKALAAHGSAVTLAVRDVTRGQQAADALRAEVPDAALEVRTLDLADLASVRTFAAEWSAAHPAGLDLLINNAGVMALPQRTTADGFEMQFGTNHLGHFALTGLLMPALIAIPRSRVVTVSSQAHRMGKMNFADLNAERKYSAWGAYGQSKLANLLFTTELQRRLDLVGISMLALAAHPGFAATNLQTAGPAMRGRGLQERITGAMTSVIGQSAAMGALPTLFAATAPGLPGGSYIGPDGFGEQRGHPRIVDRSSAAKNIANAQRLWDVSEELTGVVYPPT